MTRVFSRSSSFATIAIGFLDARLVILGPSDLHGADDVVVDHEDQLIGLIPALDAGIPVEHRAVQPCRQLVFAVGGKDVPDRLAAARAQRQPLDVTALRHLEADGEVGGARTDRGIADRQRADPLRRGHITFQQQRGRPQRIGDVVEAEIAAVARQQIGHVDVQPQQVADRVAVFRPVQAMEHVLAGLDPSGPRAVQRTGGKGWLSGVHTYFVRISLSEAVILRR